MEITPKAQAAELIKQSQKVLLLTHQDPDGDAIGSVLALKMTLEKMGKQPEVVMPGQPNEGFSFLPNYSQTNDGLKSSNDIVVTINTTATGCDLSLGYRKFPENKQVKIVVTPEQGSLSPGDISIEKSLPKYDLVVILDADNLDRLGSLKQDYPDLFYEVPTINIDHHATNSYFAKVNWVEMGATSTAEMLVALIESLGRDEPLIDADIATSLLAGLIADTGSFRNQNTSPKVLTIAAQLIAAGGRHQQVMEAIRAVSLPTLKIWGRALARVREEPEARFLWTSITSEDACKLDSHAGDGLIDELLKTVSEVDFVLLLTERNGVVGGSLRSAQPAFDVTTIAKQFAGGGHRSAAGFTVSGSLAEKEVAIIEKVRQLQTKHS